jgi:predicted porin
MKKSLITLALLAAFAETAVAQSSVKLYGSVDGGLRYVIHSTASTNKLSVGSNGTYSSNRLGFKGQEELGNDLNVHYNLETGFNLGTGALNNTNNQLFERTAIVGIGGSWGTLDVGRQFSVSFKAIAPFDPFNVKYLSIIPAMAATAGSQGSKANPLGFGVARFNNDIQYTGRFGPLIAYAEYAPGEVAGDSSAGRAAAVGAVYNGGAWSVGASYTARKTNPSRPFSDVLATALPTAASKQDNQLWMVGASCQLGAARLRAGYSDEKQDWPAAAGGSVRAKNAWAGVSYVPAAAWEATAAVYQVKGDYNQVTGADGKRNLYIAGATYAMSKRTNLYFEIDRNKYMAAAIANGVVQQLGFSSGINHMF